MAEEIQKHQLLVKLLKMTTSSNDGEALTAMRKANDILASAGWDWDRLMAGKITVVGDPFANLGNPAPNARVREPDPPMSAYKAPYTAPPPQPQPKAQASLSLPIRSALPNKFEGACYCCGVLVAKFGGFIFHPVNYHSRATGDWRVVCTTCNSSRSAIVGPNPAARSGKGSRKVTIDDIM